MYWYESHRFDPVAVKLADRHYSRRKVGSPQFVPPGRNISLRTADGQALWVTSWPYAEYVRHAWPGAWICSIFRNESVHLSSALITDTVAATLAKWPAPPTLGILTFVDPKKVRKNAIGDGAFAKQDGRRWNNGRKVVSSCCNYCLMICRLHSQPSVGSLTSL